MQIMVEVEVSIDYPEYDIEEVNQKKAENILKQVEAELTKLKDSFEIGKIVKEGIGVALVGKPNAGKSSLLNAILKEERAIVTDIEGTTRDIIKESISVRGIPINIIDTAGIRNADNKVEQIGIERSKKSVKEADFVISIFDGSKPFSKEDEQIVEMVKEKKCVFVINKMDISNQNDVKKEIEKRLPNQTIIKISAKNKEGIEEIYQEIEKRFRLNDIQLDYDTVITNVRHKQIITQAIEETKKALFANEKGMPIDMVGLSIKAILEALGQITGETVSEEIIKEIFAKFCLGK